MILIKASRSAHEEGLRQWAQLKKVHPHQVERLVCLLDLEYLRSLPVRKKSRSWPRFPEPNTYRHHFYRQAAHVLGWIDQRNFGEEFTSLVRSIWPDHKHGSPQIDQEKQTGR